MKKIKFLENVLIEKIGHEWVWIWRLADGKKVIIKWWALPWNIVDCRIVKSRKDYVEAHIIKIKEHNPEYLDSTHVCPHFFSLSSEVASPLEPYKIGCGWCKRQMMTYGKQLWLKQKIIEETFFRIKSKIPEIEIKPIIWSPLEKWYRNKIEFSFGKFIKKVWEEEPTSRPADLQISRLDVLSDWSVWFHKQGEFSKIVDIDHCDLISEKTNQLFVFLKDLLSKSWLPVHDQMRHEWFFRHLVIREWINTNQVLVNLSVFDDYLVSNKSETPKRATLLEELKNNEHIKNTVTTFVITYNNSLADVIKANESRLEILFGDWHIFEDLQYTDHNVNVQFRVSPFSFFQTNTTGAQSLFSTAMKMVGKTEWTILDLYCGTGSIWLSLLKCWIWKDLVGIEIVEDAINDARHNAGLNNVKDSVYFAAAPAEKILTNTENEINAKLKNLSLVVIDPPRDWLHKDVVAFLIELKKKYDYKLLYISCNPSTMARDIALFTEWWSTLQDLQPVDMFPQTHHIECIGILE